MLFLPKNSLYDQKMYSLLAILAASALGLSFLGCGSVFSKFAQQKHSVNEIEKTIFGLCLVTTLGGWLNVFSLINATALRIFILFSAALGMTELYKRNRHSPFFDELKKFSLWQIFSTNLLIVFVGISAYTAAAGHVFMVHDDLHSYLQFPVRALATGSLNGDPFNVRRMESALGGQSFLDTLFLSISHPTLLNIVDMGLGLALLILVIWNFARQNNARRLSAVILMFWVACVPQPSLNLTALIVAEVLLLQLMIEIYQKRIRDDFGSRSSVITLGLLFGAAATLKSTLLPFLALLFFAVSAFLTFEKSLKFAWHWMIRVACVAVFGVALPWMISSYQDFGTFLFPIFGRGSHASARGDWGSMESPSLASDFDSFLKTLAAPLPLALVVLTIVIVIWKFRGPQKARWPEFIMGFIALISIFIIGHFTGWTATYRYTFPFVFACTIFFLTQMITSETPQKFSTAAVLIVIATVFALQQPLIAQARAKWMILSRPELSPDLVMLRPPRDGRDWGYNLGRMAIALADLQKAVPAGEKLLVRVSTPHLLDFQRNTILVPDFPGATSPGTGLPIGRGPEAVASYLLSQGIRYVAYGYADQAGFTPELYATLRTENAKWTDLQAQSTFDFQANLLQLETSRKVIFNDGSAFVLDLSEKKSE